MPARRYPGESHVPGPRPGRQRLCSPGSRHSFTLSTPGRRAKPSGDSMRRAACGCRVAYSLIDAVRPPPNVSTSRISLHNEERQRLAGIWTALPLPSSCVAAAPRQHRHRHRRWKRRKHLRRHCRQRRRPSVHFLSRRSRGAGHLTLGVELLTVNEGRAHECACTRARDAPRRCDGADG